MSALHARRGGASGFTLIEILVALSIAAYALIGLLGLHNRNLDIVARDQDFTRATLLARELISGMEVSEKFPDLGVLTGPAPYDESVRWEREVTETVVPDVRQVRLRVVFDERNPSAVELLYFIKDRRELEEDQRATR